jgi:hypothetical protein
MSTYSIVEPLIVGLVVAGSALFSLRQTMPKAAARVGELARRGGMPDRLASFFFGAPKAADCGCGQCSGCGPAQSSQTITLHRSKSCH